MSGPRQITIQVESTSGAKVGDPATTTTTANDSANQNAHAHHHGKPKKFNDVLNDLAKDAVSYETRDPINKIDMSFRIFTSRLISCDKSKSEELQHLF